MEKINKTVIVEIQKMAKNAFNNNINHIPNNDKVLIDYMRTKMFSVGQHIKIFNIWKKMWVACDISRIENE